MYAIINIWIQILETSRRYLQILQKKHQRAEEFVLGVEKTWVRLPPKGIVMVFANHAQLSN